MEREFKEFVARYPWTLAKTYAAFAPHEYYVKCELDQQGQEDFVTIVRYIREHGFSCKFAGKIHIYYELDGYYYWTMGDPIKETYILNRCKVKDYSIYGDSMMCNIPRFGELNRIYEGKPVVCGYCGQGVFRPFSPEYPIASNHCFVCSNCGEKILVTPAVIIE